MVYPRYWKKFPELSKKELFQPGAIMASDGYRLNTYAAGDAPKDTIVFVNPPTIPFLLMSSLAAALSAEFRVLSWETRGAPFLDEIHENVSLSLDRHARDLTDIVSVAGPQQVHYVGWCGGSWIISVAVLKTGAPATSISLIAPNNVDGGQNQTDYQSRAEAIIKRFIDANADEVETIHKVIQAGTQKGVCGTQTQNILRRVAELNLETPQCALQWARTINEFGIVRRAADDQLWGGAATSLFDRLCDQVPVLILHCRDDDIVGHRCSLLASERNPGSKLILYPVGGHCVPYVNPSMLSADIASFVRQTGRLASGRTAA